MPPPHLKGEQDGTTLARGSTVAGNLRPVGSIANPIGVDLARRPGAFR